MSINIKGLPPAVSTLVGIVSDLLRNSQNPSMTRYAKHTVQTSRLFIDGAISNEPVITDLVRTAQGLAVSYTINAIQINQYVDGIHTVKDLVKVISTEDLAVVENVLDQFDSYISLENATFAKSPSRGKSPDDIAWEKTKRQWEVEDRIKKNVDESEARGRRDVEDAAKASMPGPNSLRTSKVIDLDTSGSIPMGKIVEVTLKNPANPNHSVVVQIIIRLMPYITHPSITPELIKLDANLSIFRRWIQFRAGEISFIKDFIFNLGKIAKADKAVRSDPTGTVYEWIRGQMVRNKNAWGRMISIINGEKNISQNIANAILVFSEDAVLRAKKDTGFDLHRAKDRDAYFRRTLSMMIFVVDPMYNQVTLYIDGLDGKAVYTYEQFKSRGKSVDPMDLMNVIAQLANNKLPRF